TLIFPYLLHVIYWTDLNYISYFQNSLILHSDRSLALATAGFLSFHAGFRTVQSQMPAGRTAALDNIGNVAARKRNDVYLPAIILILLFGFTLLYEIMGWRSAGEGRYTGTAMGGNLADGTSNVLTMLSMLSFAIGVA